MNRHSALVRAFTATLSLVLFLTNVALAHKPETVFWEERRIKSVRTKESNRSGKKTVPGPESSPVQLAFSQLPELTAIGPLNSIGTNNGFNSISHPVTSAPASAPLKNRSRTARFSTLGFDSQILNSYGTLRKISFPAKSKGPVILHIQDVHRNDEAQKNIGKTIQALMTKGQIRMVALEAEFGALPLEPFRQFADRTILQKAADALLIEKKITGAFHAAFTAPRSVPFIGVDDLEHYEANIAAYKQASESAKALKKKIRSMERSNSKRKEKTFNPDLLAFDREVERYRAGKSGLGSYLKSIQARNSEFESRLRQIQGLSLQSDAAGFSLREKHAPQVRETNVQRFLRALEMESSLNFDLVESERNRLLSELLLKVNDEENSFLLNHSVAYRLGQISHADFYGMMTDLCRRKGLSLKRYPAFDSYIRYVLLADRIEADALLAELRDEENRVYQSLIRSPAEESLVRESRRLYLKGRLVDFSLTAEEWEEYRGSTQYLVLSAQKDNRIDVPSPLVGEGRERGLISSSLRNKIESASVEEDINTLSLTLPRKGGGDRSLEPFERFYREAEIRDGKMAENVIRQHSAISSQLSVNKFNSLKAESGQLIADSLIVLVTGGFHSRGIARRLNEAGATVVSFVPKITNVDTDSGSAYLSAFTQEKTPLERLFQREKLFLGERTYTPANRADWGTRLAAATAMSRRGDPQQTFSAFRPDDSVSMVFEDVQDKSVRGRLLNSRNGRTSPFTVEDTGTRINAAFDEQSFWKEEINVTALLMEAAAILGWVNYFFLQTLWFYAMFGFADPSYLSILNPVLLTLQLILFGVRILSFGFSHKRLYYKDTKSGEISDGGEARWFHQLGFAVLGAFFRSGYLAAAFFPFLYGPWLLAKAIGLHERFNNWLAPRLGLPLGMAEPLLHHTLHNALPPGIQERIIEYLLERGITKPIEFMQHGGAVRFALRWRMNGDRLFILFNRELIDEEWAFQRSSAQGESPLMRRIRRAVPDANFGNHWMLVSDLIPTVNHMNNTNGNFNLMNDLIRRLSARNDPRVQAIVRMRDRFTEYWTEVRLHPPSTQHLISDTVIILNRYLWKELGVLGFLYYPRNSNENMEGFSRYELGPLNGHWSLFGGDGDLYATEDTLTERKGNLYPATLERAKAATVFADNAINEFEELIEFYTTPPSGKGALEPWQMAGSRLLLALMERHHQKTLHLYVSISLSFALRHISINHQVSKALNDEASYRALLGRFKMESWLRGLFVEASSATGLPDNIIMAADLIGSLEAMGIYPEPALVLFQWVRAMLSDPEVTSGGVMVHLLANETKANLDQLRTESPEKRKQIVQRLFVDVAANLPDMLKTVCNREITDLKGDIFVPELPLEVTTKPEHLRLMQDARERLRAAINAGSDGIFYLPGLSRPAQQRAAAHLRGLGLTRPIRFVTCGVPFAVRNASYQNEVLVMVNQQTIDEENQYHAQEGADPEQSPLLRRIQRGFPNQNTLDQFLLMPQLVEAFAEMVLNNGDTASIMALGAGLTREQAAQWAEMTDKLKQMWQEARRNPNFETEEMTGGFVEVVNLYWARHNGITCTRDDLGAAANGLDVSPIVVGPLLAYYPFFDGNVHILITRETLTERLTANENPSSYGQGTRVLSLEWVQHTITERLRTIEQAFSSSGRHPGSYGYQMAHLLSYLLHRFGGYELADQILLDEIAHAALRRWDNFRARQARNNADYPRWTALDAARNRFEFALRRLNPSGLGWKLLTSGRDFVTANDPPHKVARFFDSSATAAFVWTALLRESRVLADPALLLMATMPNLNQLAPGDIVSSTTQFYLCLIGRTPITMLELFRTVPDHWRKEAASVVQDVVEGKFTARLEAVRARELADPNESLTLPEVPQWLSNSTQIRTLIDQMRETVGHLYVPLTVHYDPNLPRESQYLIARILYQRGWRNPIRFVQGRTPFAVRHALQAPELLIFFNDDTLQEERRFAATGHGPDDESPFVMRVRRAFPDARSLTLFGLVRRIHGAIEHLCREGNMDRFRNVVDALEEPDKGDWPAVCARVQSTWEELKAANVTGRSHQVDVLWEIVNQTWMASRGVVVFARNLREPSALNSTTGALIRVHHPFNGGVVYVMNDRTTQTLPTDHTSVYARGRAAYIDAAGELVRMRHDWNKIQQNLRLGSVDAYWRRCGLLLRHLVDRHGHAYADFHLEYQTLFASLALYLQFLQEVEAAKTGVRTEDSDFLRTFFTASGQLSPMLDQVKATASGSLQEFEVSLFHLHRSLLGYPYALAHTTNPLVVIFHLMVTVADLKASALPYSPVLTLQLLAGHPPFVERDPADWRRTGLELTSAISPSGLKATAAAILNRETSLGHVSLAHPDTTGFLKDDNNWKAVIDEMTRELDKLLGEDKTTQSPGASSASPTEIIFKLPQEAYLQGITEFRRRVESYLMRRLRPGILCRIEASGGTSIQILRMGMSDQPQRQGIVISLPTTMILQDIQLHKGLSESLKKLKKKRRNGRSSEKSPTRESPVTVYLENQLQGVGVLCPIETAKPEHETSKDARVWLPVPHSLAQHRSVRLLGMALRALPARHGPLAAVFLPGPARVIYLLTCIRYPSLLGFIPETEWAPQTQEPVKPVAYSSPQDPPQPPAQELRRVTMSAGAIEGGMNAAVQALEHNIGVANRVNGEQNPLRLNRPLRIRTVADLLDFLIEEHQGFLHEMVPFVQAMVPGLGPLARFFIEGLLERHPDQAALAHEFRQNYPGDERLEHWIREHRGNTVQLAAFVGVGTDVVEGWIARGETPQAIRDLARNEREALLAELVEIQFANPLAICDALGIDLARLHRWLLEASPAVRLGLGQLWISQSNLEFQLAECNGDLQRVAEVFFVPVEIILALTTHYGINLDSPQWKRQDRVRQAMADPELLRILVRLAALRSQAARDALRQLILERLMTQGYSGEESVQVVSTVLQGLVTPDQLHSSRYGAYAPVELENLEMTQAATGAPIESGDVIRTDQDVVEIRVVLPQAGGFRHVVVMGAWTGRVALIPDPAFTGRATVVLPAMRGPAQEWRIFLVDESRQNADQQMLRSPMTTVRVQNTGPVLPLAATLAELRGQALNLLTEMLTVRQSLGIPEGQVLRELRTIIHGLGGDQAALRPVLERVHGRFQRTLALSLPPLVNNVSNNMPLYQKWLAWEVANRYRVHRARRAKQGSDASTPGDPDEEEFGETADGVVMAVGSGMGTIRVLAQALAVMHRDSLRDQESTEPFGAAVFVQTLEGLHEWQTEMGRLANPLDSSDENGFPLSVLTGLPDERLKELTENEDDHQVFVTGADFLTKQNVPLNSQNAAPAKRPVIIIHIADPTEVSKTRTALSVLINGKNRPFIILVCANPIQNLKEAPRLSQLLSPVPLDELRPPSPRKIREGHPDADAYQRQVAANQQYLIANTLYVHPADVFPQANAALTAPVPRSPEDQASSQFLNPVVFQLTQEQAEAALGLFQSRTPPSYAARVSRLIDIEDGPIQRGRFVALDANPKFQALRETVDRLAAMETSHGRPSKVLVIAPEVGEVRAIAHGLGQERAIAYYGGMGARRIPLREEFLRDDGRNVLVCPLQVAQEASLVCDHVVIWTMSPQHRWTEGMLASATGIGPDGVVRIPQIWVLQPRYPELWLTQAIQSSPPKVAKSLRGTVTEVFRKGLARVHEVHMMVLGLPLDLERVLAQGTAAEAVSETIPALVVESQGTTENVDEGQNASVDNSGAGAEALSSLLWGWWLIPWLQPKDWKRWQLASIVAALLAIEELVFAGLFAYAIPWMLATWGHLDPVLAESLRLPLFVVGLFLFGFPAHNKLFFLSASLKRNYPSPLGGEGRVRGAVASLSINPPHPALPPGGGRDTSQKEDGVDTFLSISTAGSARLQHKITFLLLGALFRTGLFVELLMPGVLPAGSGLLLAVALHGVYDLVAAPALRRRAIKSGAIELARRVDQLRRGEELTLRQKANVFGQLTAVLGGARLEDLAPTLTALQDERRNRWNEEGQLFKDTFQSELERLSGRSMANEQLSSLIVKAMAADHPDAPVANGLVPSDLNRSDVQLITVDPMMSGDALDTFVSKALEGNSVFAVNSASVEKSIRTIARDRGFKDLKFVQAPQAFRPGAAAVADMQSAFKSKFRTADFMTMTIIAPDSLVLNTTGITDPLFKKAEIVYVKILQGLIRSRRLRFDQHETFEGVAKRLTSS